MPQPPTHLDPSKELNVDTVDGRDWTFRPGWTTDNGDDGWTVSGTVDLDNIDGPHTVTIYGRHITAIYQQEA